MIWLYISYFPLGLLFVGILDGIEPRKIDDTGEILLTAIVWPLIPIGLLFFALYEGPRKITTWVKNKLC